VSETPVRLRLEETSPERVVRATGCRIDPVAVLSLFVLIAAGVVTLPVLDARVVVLRLIFVDRSLPVSIRRTELGGFVTNVLLEKSRLTAGVLS